MPPELLQGFVFVDTILCYDELVDRWVPGLIAGELLGYNAMTEPDGGTSYNFV